MIRALTLQNFQAHELTKLEFTPSVNVIVGVSRSGKSSLIRAIRWVIENRPLGDPFRRHQSKDGDVAVTIETDKHTIRRVKSSTENYYEVDGNRFSGQGADVPEQVKEALNLSTVNVQHQFDPPFLLFDSPGQVARVLNQIVHLDVIDRAMANINAMKRSNAQAKSTVASTIESLKRELGQFPDLDNVEQLVSKLEESDKQLKTKQERLNRLLHQNDEIRRTRDQLRAAQLPDGVEQRVGDLDALITRLADLVYTRDVLSSIVVQISKYRQTLTKLCPKLECEGQVTLITNQSLTLNTKKAALARLSNINQRLTSTRRSIETLSRTISQLEAEFSRAMPNVCPLCGSEVKHDCGGRLTPEENNSEISYRQLPGGPRI